MEILRIILSPAVTLFVGGFAIGLYYKQKVEKKRNAAQLVLQEIRYAEQIIRNARTQAGGDYSLADKLLPTNSWHENIHLFIKDLKEPQIDLISRFFSQAQYLDVVIKIISDRKCQIVISAIPVQNIVQPRIPNVVYPENNSPIQSQIIPLEIPTDLMAKRILEDVTRQIELIYNSPAVEKLIEISESKVWWIF